MPESKPFDIRAAGTVRIKAEAGAKLPTFTMLAYTGQPMNPEGWYMPVVVDLEGVRIPSQVRPILRQHDATRIVGHSTSVSVSPRGIEVAGVISGVGPDAAEIVALAKNGFQWQASIGATPKRTEHVEPGATVVVNGREVTGPCTISRETELGEISFVPLGADGDTSATVSASRRRGTMPAKIRAEDDQNKGKDSFYEWMKSKGFS